MREIQSTTQGSDLHVDMLFWNRTTKRLRSHQGRQTRWVSSVIGRLSYDYLHVWMFITNVNLGFTCHDRFTKFPPKCYLPPPFPYVRRVKAAHLGFLLPHDTIKALHKQQRATFSARNENTCRHRRKLPERHNLLYQ